MVPYCEKHVPEYHEWMKSPELQRLTGSEPLTYEEELQMQKSWRDSEDKCTFIILHKETFDEDQDEIRAMIGDTNIFLNEKIGEAEIMIAKSKFRGQKLGKERKESFFLQRFKFSKKIVKFLTKILKYNCKNCNTYSMFRMGIHDPNVVVRSNKSRHPKLRSQNQNGQPC